MKMCRFIFNKETDKERYERLYKLTDMKDYGLCPPAMNAQVALSELCRYFLGDDWYSLMCGSQEQINTEIVFEIEKKYKGVRK